MLALRAYLSRWEGVLFALLLKLTEWFKDYVIFSSLNVLKTGLQWSFSMMLKRIGHSGLKLRFVEPYLLYHILNPRPGSLATSYLEVAALKLWIGENCFVIVVP